MQMIEFGKLPAVRISAADGAQAIVTLYGGHLVSWQTADGRERLFRSARSALDGSRAIRGGVPLIFPQFGARGDGLRHGFARVCHWRLSGGGRDGEDEFARFSLAAADLPPELAAAWPFAFELTLRVALHGDGLNLSFSVLNSGTEAFPFSAALHSYFLVDQLEHCELAGLQHVRYCDENGAVALQETPALAFSDKLDRIYYQLPVALTLRGGDASLRLEQDGFTDAVVWNPGAADAAALTDMEDEEYRRFVCVEAALIEPDVLAAGAEWTGLQRIVAG
ncbi:glucose-6-phosphate 1-epimerase [Janthinobacterium sp. CG_23.3]|uniref:D-hexose-6-phosphate mutarotase n=1 Tax=unclassified Janthinobacterium TaxID=2610881 RepID=UPI00034D2319|nr:MULTISPECIES: D-hexose-6-phosphate mutarotase [unclassified Janthinobacterium]MEC5159701.1 glucose-6-phosphate 1-epimerase [Janthinobacterium sp. CG_S6]